MSDDGLVLARETKASRALEQLVMLVGSQRAEQILSQALWREEKKCFFPEVNRSRRCEAPVEWAVRGRLVREGEEHPVMTEVKTCAYHVLLTMEEAPLGEWRGGWSVRKLEMEEK